MLRRLLTELGFEVMEASHGIEALEVLKEVGTDNLPDLALIDWNMPEMNGIDLVKDLRSDKDYDGVRMVMVTSEAESESILLALELGVDEYVMKPFENEDLIEKLRSLGLLDS